MRCRSSRSRTSCDPTPSASCLDCRDRSGAAPRARCSSTRRRADVSGRTPWAPPTLASIEILGAEQPVLLVVDDAQWLDTASADVLAWVVRRLPDGLAVRLLVGRRLAGVSTASPSPLDLDRAFDGARGATRCRDRSPSEAVYAMVRSRLGVVLSADDLAWVHEVSVGNPFDALELARGLEAAARGHAEATAA